MRHEKKLHQVLKSWLFSLITGHLDPDSIQQKKLLSGRQHEVSNSFFLQQNYPLCIKLRTKCKPSPIQLEPCVGPAVRSGSILSFEISVFLLITYYGYIYYTKKSRLILEFFACWWQDPDPELDWSWFGRPKNFRLLLIRIRNTVQNNNKYLLLC